MKIKIDAQTLKSTISQHRSWFLYSGLASIILLLIGFLLFPAVGHDDSYISFWPAYTLANYGEMVNYNGERVEQSSSLLHVLVLGLVAWITSLDMAFLGAICGFLFGVATLFLVYPLAEKIKPGTGLFATFLTATSAYFIYWSFGGLETTLTTFTGLAVIYNLGVYLGQPEPRYFHLLLPAFSMLFFVLVRPEHSLLLICMLVTALLTVFIKNLLFKHLDSETYGRLCRGLTAFLVIAVILTALVFAFRYFYFGSLFPQPVTAKASGPVMEKIAEGFEYIKKHLLKDYFLVLFTISILLSTGFALFKLFRKNGLNMFMLLSLLFLGGYWSFIIAAGGDWMEGGRFFVHTLPMAMMFVAYVLKETIFSRKILFFVLPVLLVVQGSIILDLAAHDSTGMPLWSTLQLGKPWPENKRFANTPFFERYNRVHMRDFLTAYHLGNLIEKVLAVKKDNKPVLLFSGQMGMMAYYTAKRFFGKVRFYDRHALSERTFTNCRFTNVLGKYSMGLRLQYIYFFLMLKHLSRKCHIEKPDIIFDLRMTDARTIVSYGYTLVYIQDGGLFSTSKRFPGFRISANQFIALQNNLAQELGLNQPTVVDFPPETTH